MSQVSQHTTHCLRRAVLGRTTFPVFSLYLAARTSTPCAQPFPQRSRLTLGQVTISNPAKMPPPPRPTHFLCLPLATTAAYPDLSYSLEQFLQDPAIQRESTGRPTGKQNLLHRREKRPGYHEFDDEGPSGSVTFDEGYLPIAAVRPVGTLHLTLGVMRLESKERIDAASRFLETFDVDAEFQALGQQDGKSEELHVMDDSISKPDASTQASPLPRAQAQPHPFMIQLKGLHAMQQVSKTKVLYAEPIDPSAQLQPFCERLRSRFIEAGYVVDEERI